MSKGNAKMIAAIEAVIDPRIDQAVAKSNPGLGKKWASVKADLIRLVGTFGEYDLKPKVVIPNAIYAAQKTAKMIESVATSINVVDRYTRAVIGNAAKTGALPNKLQNASLSKFIEGDFGDALDTRLGAHTSTASTQASSTRKALEGLGLANVADRVLTLSMDNPFGKSLLAVMSGEKEASEAPATSSDEVAAEEVGTMPEGTASFS